MKSKEIKVPKNYNHEYDLQYDTAINKNIFVMGLTNLLKNNKDINIYFDPKSGNLAIHNKKTRETLCKHFLEYIASSEDKLDTSETFRFDLRTEYKGGNYQLKPIAFPNSSLKFNFHIYGAFKIKLADVIRSFSGKENKVKIDFTNLFDVNLFVHRPKKRIEAQIGEIQRKMHKYNGAETTVDNYNFNLFYKYYMNFDTNPTKNPFDCLDFLAKYSHCSLYIYYPKIETDSRINDKYNALLAMIPRLVLVDDKTDRTLYEGESISFLTSAVLDHFYEEALYSKTLSEMSKVQTLKVAFEKMTLFNYVSEQLNQLKTYLSMRKNDVQEEENIENIEHQISETKSILYKGYDKVLSSKIASRMEDTLYDMLDRFDELSDEKGYYDTKDIETVVNEFRINKTNMNARKSSSKKKNSVADNSRQMSFLADLDKELEER